MSIKLVNCFVAAPTTERGKGCNISSDSKGQYIAYGSGISVILRSVTDPTDVKICTQHQAPVTCAKLSPNGCYCASGDAQGNLRVWATNNEDMTVKLTQKPVGGPVTDVAWSADGERLVVVGDGSEKYGAAILLNTGSSAGSITGHSRAILSCDFKPSRPFRVATASEDTQVNLYEGPPFKFSKSSTAHDQFVNCVRYAPDGEQFISVSSDKKICFFDGKTGEAQGEIEGAHKGSIYACAWAPDGKKFATVSGDKSCKLWDAAEKKEAACFQLDSKVVENMQLGATYAGEQLVTVTLAGDLYLHDESNPEAPKAIIRGHQKSITRVLVSKDGSAIFTTSSDGSVMRWSPDGKGDRFKGKGHTSVCSGIAQINETTLLTCGMDDLVCSYNIESGEVKSNDTKVKGGACAIGVLPGTETAVVATSASLFLIKEGKVAGEAKVGCTPTCMAISPQGTIAVGGKDKTVCLFTVEGDSFAPGKVLTEHKGAVTGVGFNRSGSRFVSGDGNRQLIVWDTKEYTQEKEFPGAHTSAIRSIDFSPNDQFMATGSLDTSIIVWDLEANKKISYGRAHYGGTTGVNFMSNDALVSCGNDACVRAWGWEF